MYGTNEIVCLKVFDTINTNVADEIINNINTISDLISTKTSYNLTTQFDPVDKSDIADDDNDSEEATDYDPQDCIALIEIPLQPVSDALHPAIQQARNYLISSYGFTNQEINDMILEENGQEEDLLPLVMTMVNAEDLENNTAFNFTNLFINSAHAYTDWGEVAECAMVAIGADVLFSLSSESGGGKWKKKAIKKAFGAVAKRLLGPIGVAIAVVSFALCMGGI